MTCKSSECLYRSFFENTLDGLAYCQMVFDAQNRPIDFIYKNVNKGFEALTGLQGVVGKSVTELIPGIATSNPELFEIYGRVSLTGTAERFETYLGPIAQWFLVSASSPQKGFFFASFENITNQKQIEKNLVDAKAAAQNVLEDLELEKLKYEASNRDLKKFKLALDNASDNVIITDPQGTVVYVNKAIETVTGYTPEEVVGKKSGALWKTPMTFEYYKELWDTIQQKKVFAGEIQNRRKDGTIYTASISISPILDEKGAIDFFVAIERDITREKQIDLAKSEFVSLASHQLRTPPSIIGWYTETLQSGDLGPLTPKQNEYLTEIYRANQRMVAVINSLLNISRIEMGTFSITPRPIIIRDIIDEAVKELMSRFDHEVIVRKDYDPTLNLINVDPDIMEIIIDNLLSNAFKYGPPEKTEIDIGLKKEGDSLVLSVKDNGIGIPLKNQGQIFEKLFRADNAVSANPDGTGLGLYMIKKIIVDGIGGKIWFASEENVGTTFYVSIPISHMKKKPGTTTLVKIAR